MESLNVLSWESPQITDPAPGPTQNPNNPTLAALGVVPKPCRYFMQQCRYLMQQCRYWLQDVGEMSLPTVSL